MFKFHAVIKPVHPQQLNLPPSFPELLELSILPSVGSKILFERDSRTLLLTVSEVYLYIRNDGGLDGRLDLNAISFSEPVTRNLQGPVG